MKLQIKQKKPLYVDLVLVNVYKKNLESTLASLKKYSSRFSNLTQFFVLSHKSHKNQLQPYEIINKINETIPEFKVKEHIFIVKTKPQFLTSNQSDINLHGHSLFTMVHKKCKYLWRERKYNVPMRLLKSDRLDEDVGCCGDVWIVYNKRQHEFPKELVDGIVEFSNVPEGCQVLRIGFDEK